MAVRFDSAARPPIFVPMLHRLRPNLPWRLPPRTTTPRGVNLWRPLLALGLPPIVILAGIIAARVLL